MILLSGGMSLTMIKTLGASFIASIIVFIFSLRYFYKHKYSNKRENLTKTQRIIFTLLYLIFSSFISYITFCILIICTGLFIAK